MLTLDINWALGPDQDIERLAVLFHPVFIRARATHKDLRLSFADAIDHGWATMRAEPGHEEVPAARFVVRHYDERRLVVEVLPPRPAN